MSSVTNNGGGSAARQMAEHHDLDRLQQRRFHLREELAAGELDGMSALMLVGQRLRVQVYQGCEGLYELRGQGRGRPKAHVLVAHHWFGPSWYVAERRGGLWQDVAQGTADTVEAAADAALVKAFELDLAFRVAGGSAARQAALRNRKRQAGLVPATVWVPAAERPALIQLAERLAADPDLTCGPLRRISTGRLERL